MNKKIRLGFYMYTPMLGGAEKLLRDLLFGINRGQFEVSLFYESWPEFDTFLNLDNCPSIQIHPLPILEPSGHISTGQDFLPGRKPESFDFHNLAVSILEGVRSFYRKYIPFREYTKKPLDLLLRCLFFGPNLLCLYRALKKQDLHILHIINGGYPGAPSAKEAALVAKLVGIPVCIMTVCGTPVKREFPRFIERKIDDLVYKCVDKFIIPTELTGQLLIEYRKFGSLKFHKIPWGVSVSESHFANSSSVSNLRQQLKIPKNVQVIGTVASFLQLKGHRYLIDALSILKKKIANFHTVLVGEGPTRSEIEKQIRITKLSNLVTLTGYYPNASEIIRMFDIFVLPSITEGVPYTILEAMSQRKPIVATCVGGIPEVVVNGKTGILVSPRDSLALAQAMERLLVNPKLAQEMGKASFERYEANYTVENMIKQHEILYQELIFKNR